MIAFRGGGYLESVVDPSTSSGRGATGVFFDQPTVDKLVKTIKQFNHLAIKPADCRGQAKKFSKERFKREIKEFVHA